MKITLINPPSPYLINDAAYPPSGLMYLAASLESMNHQVEIIDFTGNNNWRKETSKLNSELFGITCVTPNFTIVKEICSYLPKEIPKIIGGAHPTYLPNDVLDNIQCNSLVSGEAEVIIHQMIKDIKNKNLKLIYEGGLVDVDKIQKPARHLLDLHKYHPGGEKTTPIYTSRGCPFNCNFCSKLTGSIVRYIPIPQILEEIEEVKNLGFKKILFGDDNIGVNNKRLNNLLNSIKPCQIEFRLNQDVRSINENTVKLAAEVGCTEISFGIESGSQKMLDAMNKCTTVEENKRALLIPKKENISTKAYFIVNYPGENEKTIKETLKFAEETMPEKWLLSSFAPLPGSEIFNDPNKYGITWMSKNWEDYYLVGKEGKFKPCFETRDLRIENQIYYHDLLMDGLKSILG